MEVIQFTQEVKMKDQTIRCRVSAEEKELIRQRCKELGYSSESRYIADKVLHEERLINPIVMTRLENIRSILNEAAPGVSEKCREKFNNEVNELWKSLNS